MRERVFPPDFPLRTRLTDETTFVLNAFLQGCVARWGSSDKADVYTFDDAWETRFFPHKLWFSCVQNKRSFQTSVNLNFRRPATKRVDGKITVDGGKSVVERHELLEANPGYYHPTTKAKYATTSWKQVLDTLTTDLGYAWSVSETAPDGWLYSQPWKYLSWLATEWRLDNYKAVQPLLADFERERLSKHVSRASSKTKPTGIAL